MNVPITQSREWQNLQNDLNESSFYEKTPDFQYLAILKKVPTGNYLYCPYGPVAEDKTSLKKALKSLKALAKNHHAIFIRIEPQLPNISTHLQALAVSLDLKLQKSTDLNPKETWILDLTGTDDDLKSKLPSRLLRYYKNSAKNGLTITKSHNPDDIKYLLKLQQALAKEKGISTFSENYLKTELSQPFATLYLVGYEQAATLDEPSRRSPKAHEVAHEIGEVSDRQDQPRGEIVAAGLVFDDKTTRYNLQGAQSEKGKQLHATGILTIELIKDAKEAGKAAFDFWGIAPEDAPENHPWKGFTNFKKTFAGYEKTYAGTYDLILNPAKYKIYTILRKLRRLV